jgi:uncharacterized protein (DUF58 family)
LPALTVLCSGIVSGAYLLIIRNKLKYEQTTGITECRRLDDVNISVEVKNTSRLVFVRIIAQFFVSDISGGDEKTTVLDFSLTPKEEQTFGLTVQFKHIGIYTAGLKSVAVYDPLGIFRFCTACESQFHVQVSPKLLELDLSELSEDVLTESSRSMTQAAIDGMDYSGVRDYAYGDPIKNIHWKLSAHASGYLTKLREATANTGVSVILNFFNESAERELIPDIFDALVEFGAAAGYSAQQRGMDCNIIYISKYGEEKHYTPASFLNIGELISDLPAVTDSDYDMITLLSAEGRSSAGQANIIVCTSYASAELIHVLLEIRQTRKNPVVFFALPESTPPKLRADALTALKAVSRANIPYRIISCA